MLKRYIPILVLTLTIIIIGCEKDDDVALIKALLDDSQYTSEGTMSANADSSSTPTEGKTADSIPYWVRFVRKIERPVKRHIEVVVNGDSATATISALMTGTPDSFGFFYRNMHDSGHVHIRPISDSTRRQVKLYKGTDGWRIISMTVWDTRTIGATNPITITEFKAEVASRNYVFRLTDPNKFLCRESLPDFRPNDTIKLTVTVSVIGDSSWAFLHRGRRHDYYWHIRQPFFKKSTNEFTRTYVISDENATPPCVRHSAIDVIGWQTLYGDSTAAYTSRAWGIPYIIRNSSDAVPE